MRLIYIGFPLTLAMTTAFVSAQEREEPSAALLPSEVQQSYLEKFANTEPHLKPRDTADPRNFFANSVEINRIPEDSIYSDLNVDTIDQPASALGQILVQISPDASEEAVSDLIKRYNFQVVDSEPRIGLLILSAAASPNFKETFSSAATRDDGLEDLLVSLKAESIVSAASRNPLLSPNILKSAAIPLEAAPGFGAASEKTDWGIGDAKIDPLWPKMESPIKVGVIDVGFADHEDIIFEDGLSHLFPANDHGNHVSGIACAIHNNGVGSRGVVPNCTVVRASGNFVLDSFSPIDQRGIQGWNALFSEITGTVLDFIDLNPDVKVVNLSLGYNWMPNFSENPEDADNARLRDEVRSLGRIHATVLSYAKRRDVIIVSAAGNDSSSLSQRLDSMWASPFNFGSRLIESIDGWTNGVIVEAHDDQANVAVFSNQNGHISAPGVNVFSATAVASNSYGEMSGTSMASPYVAGAVAMMQSMFPGSSSRELIHCLINSSDVSSLGTPRLNLSNAVDLCQGS